MPDHRTKTLPDGTRLNVTVYNRDNEYDVAKDFPKGCRVSFKGQRGTVINHIKGMGGQRIVVKLDGHNEAHVFTPGVLTKSKR